MTLSITVNGQGRSFASLESPTSLFDVVGGMGLKADRVAVEHNGEIAPRARWADIPVHSGDRLEVVHFVGGGGFRILESGSLNATKLGEGGGERPEQAVWPRSTCHLILYYT